MSAQFEHVSKQLRAEIERSLTTLCLWSTRSSLLNEACAYSLFAPGKRIRPILALESARMLGVPRGSIEKYALALELLHTASLIHDDLPGLDNDTLRRGRETSHVVFGEGIAVLAGDELYARAIALVAEDSALQAVQRLDLVSLLCRAMSSINDGQTFDLTALDREKTELLNRMVPDKEPTKQSDANCSENRGALLGGKAMVQYVLECYEKKTAFLLACSLAGPSLLLPESEAKSLIFKELFDFGIAFGLAFQITDDLVSLNSSLEVSGKNVGIGRDLGKLTLPFVMGEKAANVYVDDYCSEAQSHLRRLSQQCDVEFLSSLCDWVKERKA